jgi:hypothetical protein
VQLADWRRRARQQERLLAQAWLCRLWLGRWFRRHLCGIRLIGITRKILTSTHAARLYLLSFKQSARWQILRRCG